MKVVSWTLLASFALAGCSTAQRTEPPHLATGPLASPERVAFSATAGADARWWTFFADPALDALIEQALAHNHDIRSAKASLLEARAIFDDRDLDRLPWVTASAGYQRGSRQEQYSDDASPRRQLTESYQTGLNVQWEVDLFGRLAHLSAAAQARAGSAAADLQLARLLIAADVASAYFERAGQQRSLEVAREQVQAWKETLTLTSAQSRLGVGHPEDEKNAQANVFSSEATLASLELSIRTAEHRLDVLTGRNPGHGARPATPAFRPPQASRLPLGDVSALIARRPDVRAAHYRLDASDEEVQAATADLYPRVDLGGFIGFFSLGSADFDSAARAWQVMPSISWPALRLGNVRARIRASDARAQRSLIEYEQVTLLAREEVENAVSRLVMEQRRLQSLMNAATYGTQAVDIAARRYRGGTGTYLSVLENQRAFFQIKRDVAAAETASYLNAIALYKALGWGGDSIGL